MAVKRFPAGFRWGITTAGHHCEGWLEDNFSVLERRMAEQWVREAGPRKNYGQGPVPNWNLVKGALKDPANYISGQAADHYHRYEEDMSLIAELGLNAWRFSFEWSRFLDDEASAISHYRRYVDTARQLGLEPWACVQHFSLPLNITEGWLTADIVPAFVRFVELLGRHFADIEHWLTINEPQTWAAISCLPSIREWEPGGKLSDYFPTLQHMAEAHKRAYDTIKQANPAAEVSVAENQVWFGRGLHLIGNPFYNDYFRERTIDHQDFLAVQYYLTIDIASLLRLRRNVPRTTMGWELHPEDLTQTVKRLWHKYRKPIVVTEHGCADILDQVRPAYITQSLDGLHQAISTGVDIGGYFHFSATDNVEWASTGKAGHSGLIAIDFDTLERQVRPSAKLLGQIARANALP